MISAHRRPLRCVALLLLALAPQRVRADEAQVLRRVGADAASEARLSAELRALDLAVESVTDLAPLQSLTELAALRGKAGTLQVIASGMLELCTLVGERAPRCERVAIDPATGWGPLATAALEAFRAQLHEAPASPPERATNRDDSARVALQVAAGVAYSPGGLGARPALQLALRYEPRPFVALSVWGSVDPVAARLRGAEGSAQVRHALFGVTADYQQRVRRASLAFGAGAAYARFWIRGHTSAADFRARDQTLSAWGPLLHLGVAVPVHTRFRLRADAALGLATPRATIYFAERQVAHWGTPSLSVDVGLEIELWKQH